MCPRGKGGWDNGKEGLGGNISRYFLKTILSKVSTLI